MVLSIVSALIIAPLQLGHKQNSFFLKKSCGLSAAPVFVPSEVLTVF